jgi:hypothetical protein
VHREYEDQDRNKLIRNVQTYKVKEGSRLANLHEVELERMGNSKPSGIIYKLNSAASSPVKVVQNIDTQLQSYKRADPSSLTELTESINQIWLSLVNSSIDKNLYPDIRLVSEIPLKAVLEFLVKEGIALDKEKAREMIEKLVGVQFISSGSITETEFKKLFNKGIFK